MFVCCHWYLNVFDRPSRKPTKPHTRSIAKKVSALRVGYLDHSRWKSSFTPQNQHFLWKPRFAGGLKHDASDVRERPCRCPSSRILDEGRRCLLWRESFPPFCKSKSPTSLFELCRSLKESHAQYTVKSQLSQTDFDLCIMQLCIAVILRSWKSVFSNRQASSEHVRVVLSSGLQEQNIGGNVFL